MKYDFVLWFKDFHMKREREREKGPQNVNKILNLRDGVRKWGFSDKIMVNISAEN